jgi:biotin-dependent carboxylase-like uncharacterized protein
MRVLHPGTYATVQDLGRPGWTHLGVPVSGAADTLSLRIGNRLVGNDDGAAAIEMTLSGGSFAFDAAAVVAVAGAEAGLVLEDSGGRVRPLERRRSHEVEAGDVLRIGPFTRGARAYLCARGGFAVEAVFGSASTHAASGLGGLDGRPLRAGDRLAVAARESGIARATSVCRWLGRHVLRAVDGAHAPDLPERCAAAFWSGRFSVTTTSDRMGLRLEGSGIPAHGIDRMPTEGMTWGSVQLPDGGIPIVLLPDGQTTGGYPVVASVITADLPALGQLRPGDPVRFERVTLDEARRALAAAIP